MWRSDWQCTYCNRILDIVYGANRGLETEYRENGRVRLGANDTREKLGIEIGLTVCERPFSAVASGALWELDGDPFHQLIVAYAKSNAVTPLMISDERVRDL